MSVPRKTGRCWCGCGETAQAYFAPGHDRRAQQDLLRIVYGPRDTVAILAVLGFGTGKDNSVRAARDLLREMFAKPD